MKTGQGFKIELSSKYGEWWRYNVALMCGCFDAADNRTDFATAENRVADAGTSPVQKPADYSDNRHTVLETPSCDHILLYIYIVPHTLPTSKDIASTQPFDIDLRVTCNGRSILTENRPINQWSGASIELRIGQEGLK